MGINETYKTGRNFLGLVFHPFKTIRTLEKEKDPLQFLIVFGLPFYFWIGGLLAIVLIRSCLRAPFLKMGPLAVFFITILSLFCGLIFSYLAYWFFVWWRKRHG